MKLRCLILGALLTGELGAWFALSRIERSYEPARKDWSLIKDGLYMGGHVEEPPPGTGAVLNLCPHQDPYEAATPIWEPIPDSEPAPSVEWLREKVDFIERQRRAGVTVYVHCRAGVSRSGMVVTAYEMFKSQRGVDDALAFVRSKRPVTQPNPAFLQRLGEWEQTLKSNQ